MGLANRAVPRDALDDAVAQLCASVLANSHGTLAAYKDLYRRTEGMTLDDGLAYEADTPYDIADTNERLKDFLAR
jgi:enoyl-CoA hydratase